MSSGAGAAPLWSASQNLLSRSSVAQLVGGPAVERRAVSAPRLVEGADVGWCAVAACEHVCARGEGSGHRRGEAIALGDARAPIGPLLVEGPFGEVDDLLELGHQLHEGAVAAGRPRRPHGGA